MLKNNIYIGWDIGGAHLKYTVLKSNSITADCRVVKCELWKDLSYLKIFIDEIYKKYKKDFNIINGITMSGEMSDIFISRRDGVIKILSLFEKYKKSSFVYTNNGLMNLSKNINYLNIASLNWLLIADYLKNYDKDLIAIDFGSTTTDIILIKNNICINKRVDDFTGLKYSELIYTGILRTPVYSITNQVNLNSVIFKVIPENFATMSDIYRILLIINNRDDYSSSSDNGAKTVIGSMKRLARVFGFDYTESYKKIIIGLSKKIMKIQLTQIDNVIINHINKKYMKKDNLKIIGLGVGENLLNSIYSESKLNYISLENYINARYFKKNKRPSVVAPSYFLCKLLKSIYE